MSASFRDPRFLVTVADDFGRSPSVNAAVAEAHDKGILTSASLMAGGDGFDDAIRIVRERKSLSVGVHVTLCDGRAVSEPAEIPGLATAAGFFEKSPARAWLRCSLRGMRPQIEREVKAQFDRVETAGIHPTHVDAHHHLHMHPAVFDILCREAAGRGIGWIRIPGEPLSAVFGMHLLRRGAMPFLEWAVFGLLGGQCKRKAEREGLHAAQRIFGLSHTGFVDEAYTVGVLEQVRGPVDEMFAHPDLSTEAGRRELRALSAPAVRDRAASLGITLAGYGELKGARAAFGSLWEKP
jgi:hopanoid biosynthesis associated protein HpnK